MMRQRTVFKKEVFRGIGLHSGEESQVEISPAPPDTGIIINGTRAVIENAEYSGLSTKVAGVQTTEHLLGWLYIKQISNVYIRVIGPEIPILDGSALEYNRRLLPIDQCGDQDVRILRPIKYIHGEKFIEIRKSTSSKEVQVDYDFHTSSFSSRCSTSITVNSIDVLSSRTFCFEAQIPDFRKRGLIKGGSSNSAVILNHFGQPTNTSFRFESEVAYHKVLDFMGDLSLIGFQLDCATIACNMTGHKDNLNFADMLSMAISQHLLDK